MSFDAYESFSPEQIKQEIDFLRMDFDFNKIYEYHKKNHANITYIEYEKKYEEELNNSLIDKKIIYLDTKFWVNMRQALMNNDENTYSKLYKILLKKVHNNKIVCPVSTEIFVELLRQTDEITRKKTIEIMSSLSSGISFKHYFNQIRDDFYNYIIGKESSTLPKSYNYVSIGSVLGVFYINLGQNKTDKYHQMSMLDFQKNISFEAIANIEQDKESLKKEKEINQKYADLFNNNTNKNYSLKEIEKNIFYANLYNYNDLYSDAMFDAIQLKKNIDYLPNEQPLPPLTYKFIINKFVSLYMANALTKDDFSLLQIETKLYSAVAFEKERKLKANDFDDFRHAAIALPSADYFFTEKSLTHLLVNQTKLASTYNTVVIGDEKKAIEMIENI